MVINEAEEDVVTNDVINTADSGVYSSSETSGVATRNRVVNSFNPSSTPANSDQIAMVSDEKDNLLKILVETSV